MKWRDAKGCGEDSTAYRRSPATAFNHCTIANLEFRGVNLIRHDDPYPQYRFGLFPEPLTAPPLATGSISLDRMSLTCPASSRRIVVG
jgi:hypothetical protein